MVALTQSLSRGVAQEETFRASRQVISSVTPTRFGTKRSDLQRVTVCYIQKRCAVNSSNRSENTDWRSF
jgi:hypothetical protein